MKRLYLLTLSLALLCLLLSACSGAEKPETPGAPPPDEPGVAEDGSPLPDKDTLVIAVRDEVEGLDVQQISYGNYVHMLISEPMISYSPDLSSLSPAFAESFTLTDEFLEFVLPADAKFSNGDKLDAAAVKASMDRFFEICPYAGDLDSVESVEVVDERTVRYNFSAPAAYSLANLTSLWGGMVDVPVVSAIGEWEFNRKPVANGLYYVENWVPASHIALKRNPYFHTNNSALQNHGPANFETLVVRFIPDADECMRELEQGRVDIVFNISPEEQDKLETDPAYTVYTYQQPGVSYLNLQTDKGALKDIRVRQALTYAIDREALAEALGGDVTPTYGFIVPAMAGYSAAEEAKLSEALRFDPERAKALLRDAGWRDTDGDGIADKNGEPLRFELMLPSERVNFAAAGPILQQQFAAVGVDAQPVYHEADYIKELMRSGEYEIGSRAFEWNDADMLYWCFTEDSGYDWDDPELTALLAEARGTNDLGERVSVYEKVSERLAQDFKAISLFSDTYVFASRANVTGLVLAADDRIWLNDVVKN